MNQQEYKFHVELIENGKCHQEDFEGTAADFYWYIANLPEDGTRINVCKWEKK